MIMRRSQQRQRSCRIFGDERTQLQDIHGIITGADVPQNNAKRRILVLR